MPHVTDDILNKIREKGYGTNAGEFAAWIAVQYIDYLSLNGWGFQQRAEALAGLISATDECRKYLSQYEDLKSEQNGNVFGKLEAEKRKL